MEPNPPKRLIEPGDESDRKRIRKVEDENVTKTNENALLLEAIKGADVDTVKELLQAGADANGKDSKQDPVLLAAVNCKDIAIVKELLQAGADANSKDSKHDPVLVAAINCNDLAIVKELLQAGADANDKDSKPDPVLLAAIQRGNIAIVKELLQAGANANSKDSKHDPVLVAAINCNDLAIVKELLQAGADANGKDSRQNPVLLEAIIDRAKIAIAKELLQAGADANGRDCCGKLLLFTAMEYVGCDLVNIVKDLLQAGADANSVSNDASSILELAVEGRMTQLVKELLQAGADVNTRTIDSDFREPVLNRAVKLNDVETVQELLTAGADVNDWSTPAIFEAISGQNTDIVTALQQAGADWIVKGKESALHDLLMEANTDILNIVCSNEQVRCYPGQFNRTLLHVAAYLANHSFIRRLLAYRGIDVNHMDDFGMGPLHCAIGVGDSETVEYLLESGCGVNGLDKSGRTILHYAAMYGHNKLIDMFMNKYNLDPYQTDADDRNCLHHAVIFRHEDVVSTLLKGDCESRVKYNTKDVNGKTPSDYIIAAEKDSLVAKYFHGFSTVNAISLSNIESYVFDVSSTSVLSEVSSKPFKGAVTNITGHDNSMFVQFIDERVKQVIKKAMPARGEHGVGVVGCGSSFEETKTGLPDEFDFLVPVLDVYKDIDIEGYNIMKKCSASFPYTYMDDFFTSLLEIRTSYGLWLWSRLLDYWSTCQTKTGTLYSDNQRCIKIPLPPQRHPDRKTCTTWIWLYSDEMFKDLPVSIDFVPALSVVDSVYCLGRETSTWRMTEEEMRSKQGFVVPKIPDEKSELVTETFLKGYLDEVGRISYPTVEMEHIKALDERIRNVYITAKCLRKPEVCGLKIVNNRGEVKLVSECVTSYRLKTVFLHLVELFLKADMSLCKMVLMVYEQLERCLERGNLPMFFAPQIDVLAGSKLCTEEGLKVSRLMTRFVRCLYERDLSSDRGNDSREEVKAMDAAREKDPIRSYSLDLHSERSDFIPIYLQE